MFQTEDVFGNLFILLFAISLVLLVVIAPILIFVIGEASKMHFCILKAFFVLGTSKFVE